MYINNVGTVALALAREGLLLYDKRAVSAWQAKQVATISLWNASGRIIGGMSSVYPLSLAALMLIPCRRIFRLLHGQILHNQGKLSLHLIDMR